MLKPLFYSFIRGVFSYYAPIYFRNFRVIGREKIPKDGAVLFSPNHQNALVDPLLVGCSCGEKVHSLTRSDVFDGPLRWFLSAMQTLPVYRIRDGYQQLKRNEDTFEKCYELFGQQAHLVMFSEGMHHEEYFLRRLSKGSSRLGMKAQAKHPEIHIYLQPVGLNYGSHTQPLNDCVVVYGSPIDLQPYLKDYRLNPAKTINSIREKLQLAMQECLWIGEEDQNYPQKKKWINHKNTGMDFRSLKRAIEQHDPSLALPNTRPKWIQPLLLCMGLPNLPIHLLLKKIRGLFKDVVFHGTVNFIGSLLFFPLWWVIGLIALTSLANMYWGLGFVVLSIVFCYTRQKIIRIYL